MEQDTAHVALNGLAAHVQPQRHVRIESRSLGRNKTFRVGPGDILDARPVDRCALRNGTLDAPSQKAQQVLAVGQVVGGEDRHVTRGLLAVPVDRFRQMPSI